MRSYERIFFHFSCDALDIFLPSFADEAVQRHTYIHIHHTPPTHHIRTPGAFHSRTFFTEPLLKRTKFAQSILISSSGMDVLTLRFFIAAVAYDGEYSRM